MQTSLKQLAKSRDVKDVPGTKIFDSGREGKTAGLMCVTHGNEQCSLRALEEMIGELQKLVRGKVIITANNILAAEQNARFVEEDFNRIFSPQRMSGTSIEAARARELLPVFDEMDMALDLHSVRSIPGSPPFTVMPGGTLEQKRLARELSVDYQVIFPRFVNGTGSTSDYFAGRNRACLTLESGYEPDVDIERMKNNIRRYLAYAGVIESVNIPPPKEAEWLELSQMEFVADPKSLRYDQRFIRKGFSSVEKYDRIAVDDKKEYRANEYSFLLFSTDTEKYRDGKMPITEPFVYLARRYFPRNAEPMPRPEGWCDNH